MKRNKRIIAALFALALATSAVTVPFSVSAETNPEETRIKGYGVLGETSFDYKALPWHLSTAYPAAQDFELTNDGEMHITIKKASGRDGEHWDLEFRHRNISLRAGNKYHVKFLARASRDGLQVTPRIESFKSDEVYCAFDGEKMSEGKALGGEWGKPVTLTKKWQTFTGEFTADKDYDNAKFSFTYAHGTEYEGNAEDGDEIWFDDIELIEDPGPGCVLPIDRDIYGCTSRSSFYSGKKNNFISVNQLGYLPDRKKVAVLSDNAGDITHMAEFASIDNKKLTFEVINASTNQAVFRGTSSAPFRDADSGDNVWKLDFSGLAMTGTFYISAGGYRSEEFKIGDDIYSDKENDLLTNALNYFYQNRSGMVIEEEYITSGDRQRLAHKGRHMTDTALVQKTWKPKYDSVDEAKENSLSEVTATGGWYEAGDSEKNMVSGGMAVWTLQNMFEIASLSEDYKFDNNNGPVKIPEADHWIPDILVDTDRELEWMAQMKVPEDDPVWGEKAGGLYYHEIRDSAWNIYDYEDYYYESGYACRIAEPPTFAATLSYAACAAQAARLWQPYYKYNAEKYLKSAIEAYNAYKKYYYEADCTETVNPEDGSACIAEDLREDSLYAPHVRETASVLYSDYGDHDVKDDAYRAACELFISAKQLGYRDEASEFLADLESYEDAYKVKTRITGGQNAEEFNAKGEKLWKNGKKGGGSFTSFNSGDTASAGTLSLALNNSLCSDAVKKKISDSVTAAADQYIEAENEQGYGLPYKVDSVYGDPYSSLEPPEKPGYEYASNGKVLNNAVVMAYAYYLTGDRSYMDGVTGAMDYLLGTNPFTFSYISGYGKYCVKNPYHSYWANMFAPDSLKTPDGVITGGPNAGIDEYMRLLGFTKKKYDGQCTQRYYADSSEAWAENSPSLEMNASLAWVVSFIQSAYPETVIEEPTPTVTPSRDPLDIAEFIPGDVNCDGVVDLTDLTTLAIALVDDEPLIGMQVKNGDVNHNGELELADLATIRQYLSKKITELAY